ncbi:MAG: hypothetical protein K8R89_01900 [Anaerolineae bacterium]|nr:hypothetical protein [Anaerolineae bacterium]
MARNPATHAEIMVRLTRYAGPAAIQEIEEIVQMLQEPSHHAAVECLAALDATIGGFGIHTLLERERLGQELYAMQDRPIYRPIQYVWMVLAQPNFEWRTRYATEIACAHIEGLIKRLAARHNLLEHFRSSPLGNLLHQRGVQNALSQPLWEDLCWLNRAVYVHVKHNYSIRELTEPDEVEEERKGHLFSVEEAVAIYVIARYLAVGITEVT